MRILGIVKFVEFVDLTEANASARPLRFNEFAVVKGDNTRMKRGDGESYGDGSTFSQLPWQYNDGATSKTPATSYSAPATATLTAAQLLQKYIKTLSAAATSLTLPTATLLGTAVSAVQGTELEFEIDNSGGANTVTIVVGTGITAATSPITGGATLTVIAGTFAKFKVIFKSATTALIFRTL